MPISSIKELINTLNWDNEKRNQERWYIFLIMNPRNQTNAGIDLIKNFSYLNLRTGNITFFLPGFSNMDKGVVPHRSENGYEVVYEDESFGKIYFDQQGFLESISWLERGRYRYSEDLDIVIVKYRPLHTESYAHDLYEKNFDLHNMVVYNLDTLKREGINAIRFITECMNVVTLASSEREIKLRLENFIFDRASNTSVYWHYNINVFVAGAKNLKTERDAVISALTHITNNSSRDYTFRVKTYEDFDRSLTEEGRQAEYNNYISNNADYAIFILDDAVGCITYEEFIVAMKAFKSKNKPEIFVYSHKANESNRMLRGFFRSHQQSKEVTEIKKHLSEIGQYYIEYKDIDDLKNCINYDFRRYSL